MIGERVEQYLVQKKLGNGAMGSIYLALDTTLDRSVALKFVLSDFNNHPGMARRFLEEAKVLASLNRPNIPVLYGYFIWRDQGVMAMEYVDGETFEDMIMRCGPIPAAVSVPLVKQALQGLAAAHYRGIVHRDLKPGNLMLNREGTVKVVDFGIAKKLEGEVRLTSTNTTVGTPMYMAPEQIRGHPVDARTDIYSMGVVLYELLAGQVPFDADSLYEIQAAHVQKIPAPPTVHYPHIPKPVVDVVMKALQKAPADRFASAEEFMRALPDLEPLPAAATPSIPETAPHEEDFMQPAPIPTPASRPQPLSAPRIRKTRVATPEPPIAAVPKSAGRRNKPLIAGLAISLVLIIGAAAWFLLKSGEKPLGVVAVQPQIPPQNEPSPSDRDKSNIQPPIEAPPAKTQPPVRSPKTTTTPVENPDRRRSPDKTARVTPPPPVARPQVVAPSDLSGQWQGFYFNKASQETTTVRLSIREMDGNRIAGSLQFRTPDNTTGQCDLNGSTYQGGTLRLLMHCTPKVTYFNTYTTFQGVQPTANLLSGGTVFNASNMVASLQRN